jgi:hypothetical protein
MGLLKETETIGVYSPPPLTPTLSRRERGADGARVKKIIWTWGLWLRPAFVSG